MNEINILCAENILARYFTEYKSSGWHDVKRVLHWAKTFGGGQGIRKAEFREARKRLNIESKQIDGVYKWRWSHAEPPDRIWAIKSQDIVDTVGVQGN